MLTEWLHLRWQDVRRRCQQIRHGSDTVIKILTVNTGSSSWIWQRSGFRVQTDKADENSFPLKPSCAYFILIWMLIFKWWNCDFSCRTRRIQAGTLLLAFTMLKGAMQAPGCWGRKVTSSLTQIWTLSNKTSTGKSRFAHPCKCGVSCGGEQLLSDWPEGSLHRSSLCLIR